jgi:DNA repair protein RecO (recombination protein O)
VTVLSISAILLRAYPYGDTSQILRFITQSHGVLGAMAKGVRKSGGRSGGSLSTFSQGVLAVHFRPNRDLQTFRDFSPTLVRRGLAEHPVRLAAASVLGELVIHHAESGDSSELFQVLAEGLDAVESSRPEQVLPVLVFRLWALVRVLGYEPLLNTCVQCGSRLGSEDMARFDFGAGGVLCPACQKQGKESGRRLGPRARMQLAQMLAFEPLQNLVRPRAHLRLVSDFVTYHISGGTPLRSVRVLSSLIPEEDA